MNDFWMIMLLMNLLIPATMLVFGVLFKKKTPKKRVFFGYRTKQSMKNDDTWAFAHHYLGQIWTRLGTFVLIMSLMIMVLLYNEELNTVALYALMLTSVQLGMMMIPVFITERKLRLTFDEQGRRRSES
ncbi:MAG: SdpI family protein [Acholeplasmataceae bacterium]|nr:SdpI family protein [Acholeplasmataceae bacterium]